MQQGEHTAESTGAAAPRGSQKVPRQRRAVETRMALLQAVEDIVAAEGVEAVTTTSVAERAGVSVGSLYRYFKDRNALLLAAYDATVVRIAAASARKLASLGEDTPVEEAARHLLEVYLKMAEAIPAHAGLLKVMRSIRPMGDEQDAANVTIVSNLIAPFLKKFTPAAQSDPARLHFMNVLIGNLVDLYLVMPGTRPEHAAMREEIEAHMLLALERAIRPHRRMDLERD